MTTIQNSIIAISCVLGTYVILSIYLHIFVNTRKSDYRRFEYNVVGTGSERFLSMRREAASVFKCRAHCAQVATVKMLMLLQFHFEAWTISGFVQSRTMARLFI